ncbi:hypothetical protein ABZ636_15290 [Streptomyces sp. NPDC007251]|uniref:hypothetical protein n=1 Tax=Streptomyces sp. NPDC007251 TaxID=3154483 RepID=UPI0033D1E08F
MGQCERAGFGVLYVLGLPPFEERKGEIKASEVCRTLGSSSSTAAALKRVLPDKSSYSFDDAMTDLRTDDKDRTYGTSCFVHGDGQMLLAARTHMLELELKQHGSATEADLRDGLASLARNAALFAHNKAKCDAQSKLTQ